MSFYTHELEQENKALRADVLASLARDIDLYQTRSAWTAIYPANNPTTYLALGLASEAGELAGKVKKAIRDDDSQITPDRRKELIDEGGDVFWYLARIFDELGVRLSDVLAANEAKLNSRKDRGVLGGSGDNR